MLALAPSDDALADAVTWLTGLCLRDGWPALDSLAATLVLEEALTNILKHGLASPAQEHAGLVRLRFTEAAASRPCASWTTVRRSIRWPRSPARMPGRWSRRGRRARLAPDAPLHARNALPAPPRPEQLTLFFQPGR